MLHKSKSESERLKNTYDSPIFGSLESDVPIHKDILGDNLTSPSVAYRLIKDELMNEGNARLNLATFCQTYMEDEAVVLMSETFEKNAIDKTEYPETTEIESHCINILANLWGDIDTGNCIGTSTVGSSEACMLAGMAMKFRWRKKAGEMKMDTNKKPNLVISSGYQVCWEKFCVYWDIELRTIPMMADCMMLNPEVLTGYLDDYTIGVVGILGITYTGRYDDIAAIDTVLKAYNNTAKISVPIHVDAASGGLFAPFVDPDLIWDFRLENVISINTSGHKYGLVYPGIGWILWKDKSYLPKELVFNVDYLGGSMPTIAINFSRSASQVIGQYYNFLRLGRKGYTQIHQKTRDVARYLSGQLEKTGYFSILHDATDLPVICYQLKEELRTGWNLYDLSDRLRMTGWQIPTYPLPDALQDAIIQRIVCRQDLSRDMAETLLKDINAAIEELNHSTILTGHDENEKGTYGFTH